MAQFHVGQRVKLVRLFGETAYACAPEYLGREGTFQGYITGDPRGADCRVLFDGDPRAIRGSAELLEPAIDPKASEFIEHIKKLGREPVSARERAGEALDRVLRENAGLAK